MLLISSGFLFISGYHFLYILEILSDTSVKVLAVDSNGYTAYETLIDDILRLNGLAGNFRKFCRKPCLLLIGKLNHRG